MKTAYLDCFSGVSGDMLLGALVDVGLPKDVLNDVVNALNLQDCEVTFSTVSKNGLASTHAQVTVKNSQPHRHLSDIEAIIGGANLDPSVREKSMEVFRALARAEAAVHCCTVEDIHFHEVGAADALIDIVGVVAGFHHLGITNIVSSFLPMPHGWVKCDHGELPNPAPATCKLLEGKPVYGIDLDQELVTPTGAALLHVLAQEYGPMPPLSIERVGYGAGTTQRKDGRPNLLRLFLGQSHQPNEAQQVEVIETALDDWNPEIWPHVMERLFHAGALDVLLVPVHMKKSRPGFLLKVICDPMHSAEVRQTILSETSSIGLRYHLEQRVTLPRESVTVDTRFGPLLAKKIATPAGEVITPEFEECRRVALEQNIPIKDVYAEITRCSKASD